MKKTFLMLCVIGGTTFSSWVLSSQAVDAANLRNGGTDESAFVLNNNITNIGEVEAQAGGAGKEIFFGLDGASTQTPQSSIDFTWIDQKNYDWMLTWNPNTNTATFKIEDNLRTIGTLNYTFASRVLDRFNAFGLITRADRPSSLVEVETRLKLGINEIAFSDKTKRKLNRSVSSLSKNPPKNKPSDRQRFDKQFFLLSERDRQKGVEITSLSGTFSLDWNAINPQRQKAGSRIAFEIKMFDPPTESFNDASSVSTFAKIPEPNLMLGILGLGAIGTIAVSKRHVLSHGKYCLWKKYRD